MKINLTKQLMHFVTEYKLGDFFRNFIAVVLGIIITFAGSDWLTERNTQKEVKNIVTDAMEMLKSSALIQKISDKELALQIIKTYGAIKSAYEHFSFFNKVKEELQKNLVSG